MSITAEFAEQFFAALASRDRAQIAPYVADDAEWLIVGPIELFPYCGQHLGKDAILHAYTHLGEDIETRSATREFLVVGQDSVSALSRLTAIHRPTGREVTVRFAQFARFEAGKAREFCSIVDTLGAVEQLLGHALIRAPTLAPATDEAPALVD
jgi:ketosteroid isomerase-like protein